LYADEKRENWLFRKEPGISKIITEKMDALSEDEVLNFIHEQMAMITGDGSVFVAVEDPSRIPDSEALKFVFLSPTHPYGKGDEEEAKRFCAKLLNEYLPTSPRRRKNTLVFVLPASEKIGKILSLGRELLALEEVESSAEIKETLSTSQTRDLGAKLKDVRARFGNELQIAYNHILVPSEDGFDIYSLGLNVLRGRGDTKGYVEQFLVDNEILVKDIEPSILVSRAWPKQANYVSTSDVYEAFLKYTGVELITGKGVIRRAVAKGVSTGVFGYGLAEYPEKLDTVKFKKPLSEGEVELSEKAWLVKSAWCPMTIEQSARLNIESWSTDADFSSTRSKLKDFFSVFAAIRTVFILTIEFEKSFDCLASSMLTTYKKKTYPLVLNADKISQIYSI